MIATPTDYDAEDKKFNTSSIEHVIDLILDINRSALIVIKSTIPIGYIEYIVGCKQYPNILFSPEFLRESQPLYDNLHPSRIIVGTNKSSEYMMMCAETVVNLLKQAALDKNIPCLIMGYSEATAVKLFSNTYLAMRVAYFNELDTYAGSASLNVKEIIDGVCLDPRIGLRNEEKVFDCEIIKGFEEFKSKADIIIANRIDPSLTDVIQKVFTWDVYHKD